MYVIDKQVATDLAKELRRLAAEDGAEIKHASALECVSAGLGFADVNAMTALLRQRPMLLDVQGRAPDNADWWTPFNGPIEVTEQVARLVRFTRSRIPDAGDACWENGRRVTFDFNGNIAGPIECFETARRRLTGSDYADIADGERADVNHGFRSRTCLYLLPGDPAMLAAIAAAAILPGGFQVTTGAHGNEMHHLVAMPRSVDIHDGHLVLDLEPGTPADTNPWASKQTLGTDATITLAGNGALWDSLSAPARRLKPAQASVMTRFWATAFRRVAMRPAPGVDPLLTPEYAAIAMMTGPEWLDGAWRPKQPGKASLYDPKYGDRHPDRNLLWTMLCNAVTAGGLAFRLDGRLLMAPYGGGELPIETASGLFLAQPGGGHYMAGNITLRATPLTPPRPAKSAADEAADDGLGTFMSGITAFTSGINALVADTVASVGGPAAVPDTGLVRAYLRIDDGEYNVRFDASAWLRDADVKDIVALAENGWQGGPADQVPWHVADEPGFKAVREAMDYDQDNAIGFEAYVHGPDAMRWLEANRLDVYAAVTAAVYAAVSRDDAPPHWDAGRTRVRYACAQPPGAPLPRR